MLNFSPRSKETKKWQMIQKLLPQTEEITQES